MIYQYSCNGKCKRNFDEQRSYEERKNVFCCGVQAIKHICLEPNVFNETRDYSFTTKDNKGNPVNIHSRFQYKKFLNANGLADATIKECLSVKPSKDTGYKRKKVCKKAMNRIKEEGLAGHVKGFMKDVVKMNIK